MRVRGLVLMATVLAVAAAPAAATEKKKQPPRPRLCYLIEDPGGDTAFDPPLSGSARYDILFADVVGSRTQLVAGLRLMDTPDSTDRASAGAEWRFGLTSRGVRYEFTSAVDARGMRTSRVTIGDAVEPHTFALVGHVLVWTVKLPRAKQPTTVSDASAERRYGPLTMDTATGQRSANGKGCARGK